MNKKIMGILAIYLTMSLCACGGSTQKAPETSTGQAVETEQTTEAEKTTEPVQTTEADNTAEAEQKAGTEETIDAEIVGPWHLDAEANKLDAFAELFPGYAEFGASMEIRSNGQMSWYIGAAGGSGTYTVAGDIIHAELTSDVEQQPMNMDMVISVRGDGLAVIAMNADDVDVVWYYGDREEDSAGGEDIYPGPDVAEIVNPRGDTATVYKLADGNYMDRETRLFVYDGTENWIDEDGVEWSEQVK